MGMRGGGLDKATRQSGIGPRERLASRGRCCGRPNSRKPATDPWLSFSFGKPEKYEECAVEPDEICIGETPEMVAHVRPRHRRDLVDHDLAWLLDPGGRCHLYIDPGQRCVEGIGCQRTDRDRGGCIEPIVLNDDDGSRLAGIDTSCSSDADVASPHSAVQSTEMASTKAWSSASCSLAAMAADWR